MQAEGSRSDEFVTVVKVGYSGRVYRDELVMWLRNHDALSVANLLEATTLGDRELFVGFIGDEGEANGLFSIGVIHTGEQTERALAN